MTESVPGRAMRGHAGIGRQDVPEAIRAPLSLPKLRPVIGRDRELALIHAALDAAPGRAGARSCSAARPGSASRSCSTLRARTHASAGLRVLSTAGVEAESGLPYSGLHRILRPLLDSVDQLPAPQRSMLLAAFGDRRARRRRGRRPLPRRARSARAALRGGLAAAAAGDGRRHPLARRGVPRRRDVHRPARGCRSDRDARRDPQRSAHAGELGRARARPSARSHPPTRQALLDARAPMLSPALRRRLLAEAAGNPLALAELPTTIEETGALGRGPCHPDLRAPRAGVRAPPARDAEPDTRRAAAGLRRRRRAVRWPRSSRPGELLLGRPITVAALQPALDAALVSLDGVNLHFRHPLVRSAIYQSATVEQRQARRTRLSRRWSAASPTGARCTVRPPRPGPTRTSRATSRRWRRGCCGAGRPCRRPRRSHARPRSAPIPSARVRRLLLAAEPAFEAGRADLVQTPRRAGAPGIAERPRQRTRRVAVGDLPRRRRSGRRATRRASCTSSISPARRRTTATPTWRLRC